MPDDSKQATIEVHLPRVLLDRVRALENASERNAESIVRESLETYFETRGRTRAERAALR